MIDHDAHRRILAWGLGSGRLHPVEYNHLLESVNHAEAVAAQCAGKSAFREFAFANKIAQKSAGRNDCGTTVYRCKSCGLWHIGNRIPAAARQRTFTRNVDD